MLMWLLGFLALNSKMGGDLTLLLRVCFWVGLFFAQPAAVVCYQGAHASGSGGYVEGVAQVDGSNAIGYTDEDFVCATLDWWPPGKCDYGTCSWGLASILNLNLSSPILLNAVREFSPLKLRLGGSLQDKVIYDVGQPKTSCTPFTKNSSEMFGFTQGCLPMSRWDELNSFFKKTGAVVNFGLNALNGRVPQDDGSSGGPWDYSNAAAFIRYTFHKGYTIHGWELGNELSGNGVGAKIGSAQYADDVIMLKSILDDIYNNSPFKPLILSPGGFFDAKWFKDFIDRTKPNSLDVITHHIYNLGPGVDSHLIEKILNPSYLNGEAKTFSNLQKILQNAGTTTTAWVGEAGGAYNSGHHLVTNAFVFSFWYLDQLGMSASYDTKTYCRQSLIGGNYGLLNTTTYAPNPDYYSALLWHRLMGRKVLATNFTGTMKIRAYAHCAKQSKGVTLLLINLDSNTTVKVTLEVEAGIIKHSKHHPKYLRHVFQKIPEASGKPRFTREEYHLTAKDGDLHSQTMLLNGKILAIDQNGVIPALEPVVVDCLKPIIVAPYSIVFAHIPFYDVAACE